MNPMLDDDKKLAGLIITGPKKSETGAEVENDYGPALEAAAGEIMDAFEQKDRAMFKEALVSLIEVVISRREFDEMNDTVEEIEE